MRKLKKSHIFVIITFGIAAVLLTLVLIAGMHSDPFRPDPDPAPRTKTNSKTFDLEEYFIDSLDIDWLTGPVTVGISPDGQVHVTERSSKALDESERMDVEIGAGTLTIRWDGQWFRKFFNMDLSWLGKRDKELEVLLPRDVAQALVTVEVSNASDNMDISGCAAEDINISTISGTLNIRDCSAESLEASSVSGSVVLTAVSSGEAMSVNTVSGGMELTAISAGELRLDTVSGSCKLDGQTEELSVSTISGDISASLRTQPLDVDMDSVSGTLNLGLPANAGFTVEHDSVSGSFSCAFPTEDLGGHRLRCGSGGASIRMNTTSGNMDVKRRDI